MTNTATQALAILRDSFPPPYYGVYCEEVQGGVHGGEHYLAGGVSKDGQRRFFLVSLRMIGDVTLEVALAHAIRITKRELRHDKST